MDAILDRLRPSWRPSWASLAVLGLSWAEFRACWTLTRLPGAYAELTRAYAEFTQGVLDLPLLMPTPLKLPQVLSPQITDRTLRARSVTWAGTGMERAKPGLARGPHGTDSLTQAPARSWDPWRLLEVLGGPWSDLELPEGLIAPTRQSECWFALGSIGGSSWRPWRPLNFFPLGASWGPSGPP